VHSDDQKNDINLPHNEKRPTPGRL
jgi:hypothetical protein